MAPHKRTPEQIRASIESNRSDLGVAVQQLRTEIVRLSDWRAQLRPHAREAMIGAAAVGFFVGGGVAGIVGLTLGRGRRRRRGR